ncbi:MAG: tetratricopeptide repeat protein, partial [Bacteroidales bacterium]|nr:tetratricopeptide repeat protein [Bacteroidales bacterium]
MVACINIAADAQTDDNVSDIDRARACCRLNKPEEALYYYLAAQNALDRQTREGIIANADIESEIGLLYFNRGHYERAAANFDKALKVYNTYNQADKICQTTNLIAASAYLAEDYPKAEKYFTSLLDCCRKNKDRESEKEAMQRLADIAQKMEQYDKALKINSELVEMYSEDGDMQGNINALNNAAYCLALCGRYEDAINSFREITDADIRNNAHDSLIAAAYTNIGLCYQNMGKSRECYEYLEDA